MATRATISLKTTAKAKAIKSSAELAYYLKQKAGPALVWKTLTTRTMSTTKTGIKGGLRGFMLYRYLTTGTKPTKQREGQKQCKEFHLDVENP
ncbi:unnamed protein product [Gongylonema pulchrum]|uniref:Uncharacterized protein n=1 Tax=Gongylonema pulchrum TaxID=637853 RepID=A0A183ESD1_9BILA|nr:unnamed protein product [Gongylonema pulchrum]